MSQKDRSFDSTSRSDRRGGFVWLVLSIVQILLIPRRRLVGLQTPLTTVVAVLGTVSSWYPKPCSRKNEIVTLASDMSNEDEPAVIKSANLV